MATENELEKVLCDYLAKVPVFANDRVSAKRKGFEVDDEISINLKNPSGHPTGTLVGV